MNRRSFLSVIGTSLLAIGLTNTPAEANQKKKKRRKAISAARLLRKRRRRFALISIVRRIR